MGQSTGLGNQQERLESNLDLAWLGGIIDGEGYIGLTLAQRGRFPIILPVIAITNTSAAMVAELQRVTQAAHLPLYVHARRVDKPNCRPQWRCSVSGAKRCRHWMEVLATHIRAKREEVRLFQDFLSRRLRRAPKAHYDPEEIELLVQLRLLHGGNFQESSETIRQTLMQRFQSSAMI